ncbi:LOW QUALITY PROTEIN: hypothetical protein PHMEG_00014018 [Phytophthora megakarya]|uniref:Reverse transcriptase RNase H-like domain-containing protein n=1 Tax=Phytophthora megakarya TaxID=4795 RepID=A0A225W5Z0_9STRA|nr:LOW QUALITY PROTEIN: hypothetical protein PHMEG_00014018 [Phytophthora megakarya]
MVNAIMTIMEYSMPLVDDLLADMETYLWFRSLDAVSGFWVIMMTRRARNILVFMDALGHFEWLRMPFGLKDAPMIYQRMVDNVLVSFNPEGVRQIMPSRCVWRKLRSARGDRSSVGWAKPRTKFEADHEAVATLDLVSELMNSPIADVFMHPTNPRWWSFVDDVCFGNETFNGCLDTRDKLLERFQECRTSVNFTANTFVQSRVDFLSYEVTDEKGMQSFLGALNYYSRFIQDFAVYVALLYHLNEEGFTSEVAKRSFATLQQIVADVPLLRHLAQVKPVPWTLFAKEWALSATLMLEYDGKMHHVHCCCRVLNDAEMNYHSAEKEVLALLLLLKMCYTQLVRLTIHAYTRFSTLDWVHKSKPLFGRATQFAVLLFPLTSDGQGLCIRTTSSGQANKFCRPRRFIGTNCPTEHKVTDSLLDPHLLYACLPQS